MRNSSAKYTLINWYYLGLLFLLAVFTYLAMPDTDNTAEVGTGLTFIAMVGLAIAHIPLLLFIWGQRIKGKPASIRLIPLFILFYAIYFCWMTAITILNDETHNLFGLITMSLTILVFPFILSSSYFRAKNIELDKWFYMAVIFLMLCICLQYKNIYSFANILDTDKNHIGISYTPLFILPILLLSPSRIIRYASIILTSIIIISSVKRSGILALGACLMIYVFVKQYVSGTSKLRRIITILAVIAVMGGVVYYLMENTDNNIIERIQNISDDGGSGRDILWVDTYNNIHNRDIGYQFVGNGYRSSQKVSVLQLPAHNDFLEIWYDFGGIGLALYMISFLSLCLYALRLLKRKSQYAPHLAMVMTFYFIFSMTSIVILYFWMALLLFSVGIIAGLADKKQEKEIETKKSLNNNYE